MNFAIVLLFLFLASAETSVLSLQDVSQVSLSQLKKEGSLLVAFQADCASCKKQIRDLSCLENDYSISLIGMASSEKNLRYEYRKMKTKYPAYYADSQTLKQLKISNSVTPQIILWKKDKTRNFNGYKKCEEYRLLLKDKKNG